MNKLAKLTFFVMLLLTCILIVGCKGKNPTKKISKIISEIICDKLNQSCVVLITIKYLMKGIV